METDVMTKSKQLIDKYDLAHQFDENGNHLWYATEEIFDELGRKLIAHFGEDFRVQLNQDRAERGMKPI